MTAADRGIRVRGLRKSFRSFRSRHDVLRGVEFHIAPGEVVGLIGPNGAGKTTLMSCLLGFLHPDAGEIEIDGLPNDHLDVRRRTGFVPERMNLGRRQTGRQFLRYMARLSGVPRADLAARTSAMLDRLGIGEAADQRLAEYSRGMLQRLALCQAVIHEPEYVFLDEPASGLDPNGVLLVRDIVREQSRRGASVLLNSHQLAEVEKVCDRVLFLHDGVIARAETLRHEARVVVAIRLLPPFDSETVERLTGSKPDGDVVVISTGSEGEVAAAIRALVLAGVAVVEVKAHTADLEAIFRGVS